MKQNIKRKYPYIVARNKENRWEYYLTIKPNKRVYLQGISKCKILDENKILPTIKYMVETRDLKNGHMNKPFLAKQFYKSIFGKNRIATKI